MKICVLICWLCLALESFFCFLMKCKDQEKHKKNLAETEMKTKKEQVTLVSKVIMYLYHFACDLTVLLTMIVGFIPCHTIRMFFYRYIFHMTIAPKVVIHYGLEARSPWNISLGKGCIIGDRAILDARFGIVFGENVNLSTGVWIWTLQHNINSANFGCEGKGGSVHIGDRVWLGSRVVLLPGVSVAEGAVIASSALVSKSCTRPFEIYAGVPAKSIGQRTQDLTYEFNGTHRMFL